ncbi:MAG TPA: sigma-70 family RNA polymerase sigma factor [Pirellulales bacterium]
MPENSKELLDRYRRGDGTAADALFEKYTGRLLALARSRLSPQLARRIDADDVIQSTYRSFFMRARQGEFTADREGDLWRLLATITLHKLWRQAKHHRRAKRSPERESTGTLGGAISLSQLVDREPSVADVVMAADELRWLESQLEPIQRRAVRLRLQDLPATEIAAVLGRSERSVRRWLAEARELLVERWADQQNADDATAACEHDRPSSTPPVAATHHAAPLEHADYHFEALIGSGGMAKVYTATHRATGRRVAIKVLRKRLTSRPRLVDRFVNEAGLVARFQHPNIVPVHGLGRLPDGGYFMVMDLVDGNDLTKLCIAGLVPAAEAVPIVAAVADAVQHAHEHGVIHRDLKPGNVLVDRAGHVFVTDFGFAWTGADSDGGAESIVGTAGFMAPEQIDRTLGEIGPATDIYGLGALLMMLCCGHPPHRGGSASEIIDRVVQSPDDLPPTAGSASVPHSVRAIWQRCLARDWRQRFRSAADVAVALRSAGVALDPVAPEE